MEWETNAKQEIPRKSKTKVKEQNETTFFFFQDKKQKSFVYENKNENWVAM